MVVTGTNERGTFEFHCKDETLVSSLEPEYFGESSKCLETNLSRPICMKTICDSSEYKVKIVAETEEGGTEILTCDADGDMMQIPTLPAGSMFQCPSLSTVCPA